MTTAGVRDDGLVGMSGSGYRARPDLIKHRAIDHGIKLSAPALGVYLGVNRDTARRILNGEGISPQVMRRIMERLARPGETLGDLFEPVDE